MFVIFNGKKIKISDKLNLSDFLNFVDFDAKSVATSLNGEFVAIESRDTIQLSEGDIIEALSPAQGG